MGTEDGGKRVTEKQEAERALNQLLSLIVGSRFARETDCYKENPLERIRACYEFAVQEQTESFGDTKKMHQINRKLDALKSLTVLAQLTDSVNWA